MDSGLRVVRLHATNFKRLRVVDVEPPSGAVVVAGRNGQGKSSILDAIISALGGKRVCPPQPVRLGTERAEVLVDLGELEILRTFGADGATRVRVRTKDGAEPRAPQALLDDLCGPFLDPLAFTRLSPLEQRRELLGLLDLGGFDLAASEAKERGAAEDRRDLRKDRARVAAERDGIGLPPELPPGPAPDVGAAVRALEDATATAARVEAARVEAERAGREAAKLRDAVGATERRCQARIDEMRTAIARAEAAAQEEFARAQREAEEAEARAAALAAEVAGSAPPDVAAARAAVEAARAVEAAGRRRARWRELDSKVEELDEDIFEVDQRIEHERAARAGALAAAPVPVPGLEIAEDGLRYRGVPFSQAAQSEQLRVAVGLAMARRPRLRVLRVQEGALLDAEHLQVLREEAERAGFQVWIEKVDSEGADLVIEDGTVVGAPAPAEPDDVEGVPA